MVKAILLLMMVTAEPGLQPLTLAQAIAQAEQNNPDLQEAQAALPVAEAGVELAGQLPNPTLTGSAGPDEPTVSAQLDERLPIFGQRGSAIRAAQAQVGISRASVDLQQVELRASVRRAYFTLAEAQGLELLLEQRTSRARTLADSTQRKFELGSASQLDVEQASLALRRAEQALEDGRAQTASARVALAALTGQSTALPQAIDPFFPLPQLPPLPALLTRIGSHPEVVLAHRQEEAAQARSEREGAAVRPTPDLAVTFERLTPCSSSFPGACPGSILGLRAGISFDLPVLSQNRGAVHQAQREADQAALAADAALKRRTAQARIAYQRFSAASRRSRFLEETVVPQALRVEKLARLAYEAGRVPLLNVLQAQNDVSDVQAQDVSAGAAAQSAYADVEEALGASL